MAQDLTIASYPHLKAPARKDLHRSVHKAANPDLYDVPKSRVSLEELSRILGNGRR